MSFDKAKYTAWVDTDTYNLANSVTAGVGGNWPAFPGVFRIVFDIKHDQTGTVKWYKTMTDADAN